jgi:hypothetical protein
VKDQRSQYSRPPPISQASNPDLEDQHPAMQMPSGPADVGNWRADHPDRRTADCRSYAGLAPYHRLGEPDPPDEQLQ